MTIVRKINALKEIWASAFVADNPADPNQDYQRKGAEAYLINCSLGLCGGVVLIGSGIQSSDVLSTLFQCAAGVVITPTAAGAIHKGFTAGKEARKRRLEVAGRCNDSLAASPSPGSKKARLKGPGLHREDRPVVDRRRGLKEWWIADTPQPDKTPRHGVAGSRQWYRNGRQRLRIVPKAL